MIAPQFDINEEAFREVLREAIRDWYFRYGETELYTLRLEQLRARAIEEAKKNNWEPTAALLEMKLREWKDGEERKIYSPLGPEERALLAAYLRDEFKPKRGQYKRTEKLNYTNLIVKQTLPDLQQHLRERYPAAGLTRKEVVALYGKHMAWTKRPRTSSATTSTASARPQRPKSPFAPCDPQSVIWQTRLATDRIPLVLAGG
jgi:hypothetical protein